MPPRRRSARPPPRPPSLAPQIAVVVTGTDADGDALARPVEWDLAGPPPVIVMLPEPRGQPALAPGERVVARLRPIGGGRYEGRTLERLSDTPGRILGVYRRGRIAPSDRRAKAEWRVAPEDAGEARDGDIVLATPLPGPRYGLKPARIIERLGREGEAGAVSLIAIHSHQIPTEFPAAALAEAAAAGPVGRAGREDLRALPLVTIDGEDARDFDDAVFAEPRGDGFRLVVAIADVAHYVPAGSALDREARRRGNSCYFPDRVVPMLPEALSNGWCSLRPGEERGCLFAEILIDGAGRTLGHRFGRGLMQSTARLTYAAVQEAHDAGREPGAPLGPLYAAFGALIAERRRRGTLDLELPERQVVLDPAGRVRDVIPRPRLASHRLIEEFMVLANVCAAEELERLHRPCVYRVHAPPAPEKLEGLRSALHGFGIALAPGDRLHPRDLDRVLTQVAGTEAAAQVHELVLRSQSQAEYSADNIGHFGLGLARYAHFTSPIRRYADLLVHRALLAATPVPDLAETCLHITATERRAALAERDATDRYLALFMADKVGARFPARISGVTRFGLFVTVAGNGASGLVPLSTLPDDFWIHDPAAQTLTGRRRGTIYRLADAVTVRLSEASPATGGLVFRILPPDAPARKESPRRQ